MPVAFAVGYASIFFSASLYWLSSSMIRPVMSLYFADEGYAALTIGLFMALNSVLPILLAMPMGSWIDRVGTRRAVGFGSVISLASGVAFLIGANQANIAIILVGQIVNGIGGMLSWGALQAAVSLSVVNHPKSSKNNGSHVLSNFTFFNSLAQMAGPALGGFLSDSGGYHTLFYAFSGMNLMSFFVVALIPSVKKKAKVIPSAAVKPALWGSAMWKSYADGYHLMCKNKSFTAAITLNGIMFMLIDVRTTFFPLYLSDTGFSHTAIGMVLSISTLGTLLVRPVTGHAINWLGHYRIMLISMMAGGVCLLLLAFNPWFWLLTIIMFVWGLCTGINQPMALIMVSQSVEPREQGMGMSIRTMSNRIVQLINPVLFGTISTALGLTFGFGVMGGLLLIVGGIYRRQNRLTENVRYKAS
ncbi:MULTISPECIES: MFS transporter [unclassified Paenibacillus]|uniref:MFS transporter n=1 Tax=unclassified Paenibacillus TaxID=185978 RepID=UPI001AE20644|nr:MULTISPECIES: MFS transporter [unclassified Paenibacillus]MBP1154230.1 MFS family permease [Paenibacillus sp. PvP091]MBP1170385.1 MFS family permease [Paenibacillus sp. PvR098]MBP2441413.1 MFS family permease [Paenibacillus sp. PvP052]